MGPDVLYADSNYLYMAGVFRSIGDLNCKGIASWNGIAWDSLNSGIDGLDTLNKYPGKTNSIIKYNGKLYVGGSFSSLGNVKAFCIGTWDGSVWDSLSIQAFEGDYIANIWTMQVINNKLYVGGTFDSIEGVPCVGITAWNDTSWTNLNFPIYNLDNFEAVDAICEYNGSIYVGGTFYGNTATDSLHNILRYDSAGWHSVGAGIVGNAVEVESMVVYQGELYVAGYFTKSEGDIGDYIQRWDGNAWHDVGGGTGIFNGQIHHLLVYHGKLYAMGVFQTAGGIPADRIASWDGTEWCSLGSTFDNVINTGCIFKDSLYIGGGFSTIDGDSMVHIAEWAGGNYTDTCGSISTSVSELDTKGPGVKVYPNPSNGKFAVQLSLGSGQWSDNAQIEVYNMLGEKVYEAPLNPSKGGPSVTTLDISGQPTGIYMYRVITGTGKLVGEGKLVIE